MRVQREDFRILKDILTGYEGPGGDVTVPEGVRAIGRGAFAGCDGLTGISLPETCREIQAHAFETCRELRRVLVPEGLLRIGSHAFWNCRRLERMDLPETLRSIGEEAFCGCAGLTHVFLPGGIRSIGTGAFGYCEGLTDLVLPEGITVIEPQTFQCCSRLEHVTFPRGLISIERQAFFDSGIREAYLPDSVRWIEEGAFQLCGNLARVRLPEGIERIGYKVFYLCPELNSLRVPAGVREIQGTIQVHYLTCYTPYAASFALCPIYLGGSLSDLDPSKQKGAVMGFFYALENGMTEIGRWRGDYAAFIREHLDEYTDLALSNRRALKFLLEEGLLAEDRIGELLDAWLGREDLEIRSALLQYQRERTGPGGPGSQGDYSL